MLTLETTSQFRRDYRRAKKRGYDMALLKTVVDALLSGQTLDARYRDHQLTGRLKDYRECHILPDWLLMYRIDGERLILLLGRTGSHSDLFGE